MCGINYPTSHTKCPVCEESTDYITNDVPGEHWQWQATAALQRRGQGLADPDGIILLDVPITKSAKGYLWINSWDVIDAGVSHRFPPDEVIAIGPPESTTDGPANNLYEVIAYIDERRAYWIQPLRVPDYIPDLGGD